MKTFCCKFMKCQLTKECVQHPNQTCPDQVIRKYKNNYGIPHADGISYYRINFCPACGKKLH